VVRHTLIEHMRSARKIARAGCLLLRGAASSRGAAERWFAAANHSAPDALDFGATVLPPLLPVHARGAASTAPQCNPAPKAANTMGAWMRPPVCFHHSAAAISMEADEVLP